MLRPSRLRNLLRFGMLLGLLLISAFVVKYHRRHQSTHNYSTALPVSDHPNQNHLPTAANNTHVAVVPPSIRSVVAIMNPNQVGIRSRSTDNEVMQFSGNRSISTAHLEEFARSLKNISPDEFSKELGSKLKGFYRTLGYLKADAIVETDPSDPGRILIKIDEGKQYRWGNFRVNSEILEQNTIYSLFHVEKGWPANLSDIPNMFSAYMHDFKEKGYVDCAYTPHLSFDDESGQVNLQMDISEGPRYIVQNVSLDSSKAQSVFSKLQGQYFSPSLFHLLLNQTGLTEKEVRLDFNPSRGEVSILASAKP
jgi:hypothetical protein